mmetsp:Transcript_68331/g.160665  ORF Transcript_68331/g.160665 Transcript_68331/m.160665 type:complete len:284 (-) Transcript_68331:109-960(-)
MVLEVLELLVRTQVRVVVIKTDDVTHQDLVVAPVVDERAAPCLFVCGPADGVGRHALLVLGWIHLPHFLEPNPKGLVLAVLPKVVLFEKRLCERTPTALCKNGLAGPQFEPACKIGGRFSVSPYPNVVCGNSLDAVVLIVKHLARGKPAVDLNTGGFTLRSEPLAGLPKTDDVIAFVMHRRRCRQSQLCALVQQPIELVVLDRNLRDGVFDVAPVRKKFIERAWFENVAGENMRPNFRALLHNTDSQISALSFSELLQPECGGEPCRTGSHNHDIILHVLAGF